MVLFAVRINNPTLLDQPTMIHRLISVFALAALSVIVFFSNASLAQEKAVNIYNWSDYIDPKVLEDFTKETGIKVVYDAYDSSEIMELKVLAGKAGYDVVGVSAPLLQRFVAAGVLMPLERAKLSNNKHLWPLVMDRLKTYDPGNTFAMPYLWGTIGFGVNVAKVKERLGGTLPESWDLLLDPKYSNKLKDCGIHVLDSPEDILPAVLRALKLDPNSKNLNDIQKASDAVFRVRGNVRKFHSFDYINGLATGDICLALGFSGDIQQASKRAKAANNGVEIAYIIPKEGAQMWFDSLVIPRDAPNPQYALTFINYMLRSDIAAANSNLVESANANIPSRSMIKRDVVNNPNIFPNDAMMKQLFTIAPLEDKLKPMMSRLWIRIKSGK
jgi:putrescine transport system substrate-binding protein